MVPPAPRGVPDTRPVGGAQPATCEFTCSAHAAHGIPVQAHRPLPRGCHHTGPWFAKPGHGHRHLPHLAAGLSRWLPTCEDFSTCSSLKSTTLSNPCRASQRCVPQARTHPTRSDLAGGDCARVSPSTMQLALAEASAGPMDEVANPHHDIPAGPPLRWQMR